MPASAQRASNDGGPVPKVQESHGLISVPVGLRARIETAQERLQVTRAIPVRGNVTRAAVRFERDADFGALVGSQVRLLAHLDRATVYAIGFR